MVHTFDYDRDYTPSMPVADIKIGRPRTAPFLGLRAILDSGADATIIPVIHLKQVGARKTAKVWMRGTADQRRLVDLYTVCLQLGDLTEQRLMVVGGVGESEIIVGRDVLNHLIVTLNGLAAVTEVTL